MKNTLLFLGFLLVGVILFGSVNTAKAEFWGASAAAASTANMLQETSKRIDEAMLGYAKQEAVEAITNQIDNMIAFSSDGALFITDWEDELTTKPLEKTNVIMNDYYGNLAHGIGTSYYQANTSGTGYNLDYVSDSLAQAKTIATGGAKRNSGPDFYESVNMDTPDDATNGYNWAAMLNGSRLENQPGFQTGMGTSLAATIYEEEKTKIQTQAIANQGFYPKTENGKVVAPGSTLKDITSAVKTLSLDVVANATSVNEVITASVTRILSSTIEAGVGNISTSISRGTNASGGSTGALVTAGYQGGGTTTTVTGAGGTVTEPGSGGGGVASTDIKIVADVQTNLDAGNDIQLTAPGGMASCLTAAAGICVPDFQLVCAPPYLTNCEKTITTTSGQFIIGIGSTTAAIPVGSVLKSWSGSNCIPGFGSDNICSITPSAALGGKTITVRATFGYPKLTVSSSNGYITGAGIDCGAALNRTNCTEQYIKGASVVLTWFPTTSGALPKWSGCDTVGGEQPTGVTCTVTMGESDKTVYVRNK